MSKGYAGMAGLLPLLLLFLVGGAAFFVVGAHLLVNWILTYLNYATVPWSYAFIPLTTVFAFAGIHKKCSGDPPHWFLTALIYVITWVLLVVYRPI